MTVDQEGAATPVPVGQEPRSGRNRVEGAAKPKRPAIARTDAATCRCGARWTGTSKCHCSADGCHRLFSSVGTFDRHRVNGACVDPATIQVKPRDKSAPRPAMTFRDGVWCFADEFTGADQLFRRET